MCRASLSQCGWNSLFVMSTLASEDERHLGEGNVSHSFFTTLLSFEGSNIWTASKLSLPKTCPQDQEASFPSENQPHFKSVFVSAFGFQNFCELHQHHWQTGRCPNLNRNQSSVTILKKKLLCFLTCTTNSGSNLSLWLRTCHNNLFLFSRKQEQHLALLQLQLIWKICKLTCNLIKMTWSHQFF